MKYVRSSALALALHCLTGTAAWAHFNMLLLQPTSARAGKAVTVVYQWGHPFEHQLFDSPTPKEIFALSPSGKRIDLAKELSPARVPAEEGKQATIHRLSFTPEERGDYLLILSTPPIWMEEDKEFLQDTVKVILHVQAQNGWDRDAGQLHEMVPLTRPYALQPGMTFQAQARSHGKPLSGAMVEIERYNATALKDLPPDEHRTYTAKTDPNGVVTCTLPDPGWWCLTAHAEEGKMDRAGKTYPLRHRTSLWLFVDDKINPGK